MKIKSLPQVERPVEKAIIQGIDKLSNAELLAIILGSGTKDKSAIGLAEELISQNSDGILTLADISIQELMAIKGIGQFKATRVLSVVELGKRIATSHKNVKIKINTSDDLAKIFVEKLRYEKRELFEILLLNSNSEVISVENVSVGELTSTLVHPREVFSRAVKKSAAAVVFAHNHPSGDPTPSIEDIETTERLRRCGELLGINVIDHIIVGDGIYSSLRALGKLKINT